MITKINKAKGCFTYNLPGISIFQSYTECLIKSSYMIHSLHQERIIIQKAIYKD